MQVNKTRHLKIWGNISQYKEKNTPSSKGGNKSCPLKNMRAEKEEKSESGRQEPDSAGLSAVERIWILFFLSVKP